MISFFLAIIFYKRSEANTTVSTFGIVKGHYIRTTKYTVISNVVEKKIKLLR